MKVYQILLLVGFWINFCYSHSAGEIIIVPDPYLSEGFKNWLQELLKEQQNSHFSIKSAFETIKRELPSAQELRWTKEPGLPAVAKLSHARPFLLLHRLNNTDVILTKSGNYTVPACYATEVIKSLPSMIIEEEFLDEKKQGILAKWAQIKSPLFFSEYTCRWKNKNYIALTRPQNPSITVVLHPQKMFSELMQEQLQKLYSEFADNTNRELIIDTRFKNWVISKHALKKGLS